MAMMVVVKWMKQAAPKFKIIRVISNQMRSLLKMKEILVGYLFCNAGMAVLQNLTSFENIVQQAKKKNSDHQAEDMINEQAFMSTFTIWVKSFEILYNKKEKCPK